MRIDYTHYKLPNGMEILLIPSDTTYSVTVEANLRAGSAYENKNTRGLTHFVEHLALKATKKWPTKYDLINATEQAGATYNGGTGREYLYYEINVPYTKLDFGIEFIYEILFNSLFISEEIESERQVILDEISKAEDYVGYRNFYFITRNILTQKSQYIYPIAGIAEDIKRYDINSLKTHYKNIHQPSNILFSITGNFELAKAKKLIDNYLKPIKPVTRQNQLPQDNISENVISTKKDKLTELVLFTIILNGLSFENSSKEERIINELLLRILGGMRSSRLFSRLRNKEGLLYSISTDAMLYQNFGYLDVNFDINPSNFKKAFKITLEELARFSEKGITISELEHVKEYAINRNLVTYDNIHSYSNLVKSPFFRKEEFLKLEQINEIIKSINIEKSNKMIQKLFNLSNANVFAYGKVSNNDESEIKKEMVKYKR